jgi:Cu+-exporting ATPase
MATDPVCRMEVEPGKAAAKVEYAGQTFFFCSETCHKAFIAAPQAYVQEVPSGGHGAAGEVQRRSRRWPPRVRRP